ncbi:MAG TPA: flagellar motor protein MotB [Acidiphilium sp.]|nr:flagellar motor protein MotB [Acidiphilium sp.]
MAQRKKKGGKGGDQAVNLVIRREEIVESGHHGGAWKIAYADFVTAMMAFFLLMWLISATTKAQRIGLADYFSQANVLNRGASGEGKPFGGKTPFDKGSLASDLGAVRVTVGHNPVSYRVPHTPQGRQIRPDHPTGKDMVNTSPGSGHQSRADSAASSSKSPPAAVLQKPQAAGAAGSAMQGAFGGVAPGNLGIAKLKIAGTEIKNIVAQDPNLASLSKQISVTVTPEGLRIQIMDAHKRPMFALGSSQPNPMTLRLLTKIAPILSGLGDNIRIAGYTDARPYVAGPKDNWDLSVERANATRQVLVKAGFPKRLIARVSGYADHKLLISSDPMAAANRRVGILVVRPALPQGVKTAGAAAP